MYTAFLIDTIKQFGTLKDRWNTLLSTSSSDNIFLRWEWLWHWWAVYSRPGDKLAIVAVKCNGELVGIAPFYIRMKRVGGIIPMKTLMFLGTQAEGEGDAGSDYMDIFAAPGHNDRVFESVFGKIAEEHPCDEIFLSKINNSSAFFSRYTTKIPQLGQAFTISESFPSPYISLPASFEDYLNQLPSSMRQKIRKERRNAEEYYPGMHYRTTNDPSRLEGDMQELIALHQRRWQDRGKDGAFSNSDFLNFHRQVMPELLEIGCLSLVTMSQNNRQLAVLYNLAYNGKIYFYQSGIDTEESKAALGYVLHAHCIEEAIRAGMTEYDFLPEASEKSYKFRFAKNSRTVVNLYMACSDKAKRCKMMKETLRAMYYSFSAPGPK